MSSPQIVRFGVFELDRLTGELRKGGVRVKLQEQPFRVLAELTSRPNELVTREELRDKLWPGESYGDFDQNLNAVIKKVRQALGDSSETPRFIETLPKRGYRFIYPVEGANAAPGSQEGATEQQEEAVEPLPTSAPRPPLLWVAGIAVAVVVALALAIVPRVGEGPKETPTTPSTPKSVAVLPLENLSGDPEQEYFTDGMTDELISHLGRVSGLRVISRTSAMVYKGTDKPLPDIARELNVSHVVEGSVLRIEDQVRITTQLISAGDDRQLWSSSYQRSLQDILGLQGEVAGAIAAAIEVKLTPQEEIRLATARRVNPEAYLAYLKGVDWLHRGDVKEARHLFQQALEEDPEDPLAWVGLGASYASEMLSGDTPAREVMPLARAAHLRAVELDDMLPEVHAAFGVWREYEGDWVGAEQSFLQALELHPSSAMFHQQYGHLLIVIGRLEEGRTQTMRALELDPVSLPLKFFAAWHFNLLGEYDEAIELCEGAIKIDPGFFPCFATRGESYAYQEKYEEALADFEKAMRNPLGDIPAKASAGYVYARQGRRGEAQEILREFQERSNEGYISPYWFALLHLGLGDDERALDWLEKAYEEGDWVVRTTLPAIPYCKPLHSHPRFQALLKKMNMPQ